MGPAHVVSGVVDPELDGGDGLVARGTVMVRMAERTLSDMQGRRVFVSGRLFFFFLIFHPSGCQAMFLHTSGRRDGLPRDMAMTTAIRSERGSKENGRNDAERVWGVGKGVTLDFSVCATSKQRQGGHMAGHQLTLLLDIHGCRGQPATDAMSCPTRYPMADRPGSP